MKYIRTIESMGENIVLVKIKTNMLSYGLKYHILLENKLKPPMDIQFEENGNLYCVKYIIQDEFIEVSNRFNINEYIKLPFRLPEVVDESNYIHTEYVQFKNWIDSNSIWIVKTGTDINCLNCLKIDENNMLLFVESSIVGIVFKNINNEEMKLLENLKCDSAPKK